MNRKRRVNEKQYEQFKWDLLFLEETLGSKTAALRALGRKYSATHEFNDWFEGNRVPTAKTIQKVRETVEKIESEDEEPECGLAPSPVLNGLDHIELATKHIRNAFREVTLAIDDPHVLRVTAAGLKSVQSQLRTVLDEWLGPLVDRKT